VVSAGVEFAIVKTSFQGMLANIFLSVLAVWLPLIPLIFVIRKIMEDRNSTSRCSISFLLSFVLLLD
jgi:cell division protease FtsH